MNIHQVISHIPFDTATSLINNAVVHDMDDQEESKYDLDIDEDMNIEL